MAELNERLEGYLETALELSNTEDLKQSDRNASIDDITMYIHQSLLAFQGMWSPSSIDDWIISMPYARYLSTGDTIKNLTTGERYTIRTIVNKNTKTIKLTGTTAPVTDDRLELSDDNVVNFVAAYPKNEVEPSTWVDHITYKIIDRQPGNLGGSPFSSPREIKPRVRQVLADPDYPDYHIWNMGQWFDNLIQFDCWSNTNNGADSLISWFEDFMYKYTWVWKRNGVSEVLYWRRTVDEEIDEWRNDIANRTVIYYFRTEKLIPVREHDLKQIDLFVELESSVLPGISGVYYTTLPASGYTEILDRGIKI